jgi:hypothetical protein
MTETERNQHNQQIETLYALYQQASSQRDVLMARQTQQIEAWKQRSKEAKTKWQGLTDDDVHELTKEVIAFKSDVVKFIREAEAKLREKNA